MSWPSPTDYNEAIQNPRLGFDNPELKLGKLELTPLGTPRPYSGAFATVYKVQCAARTWAVRCFNREYDDQQERYEAIGAHLARVRLPYTVGFEYLRKGLLVRGAWFPICEMEWVRGETLSSYIAQNLGDVEALLQLAEQWRQMLADLRRAAVAHGDLSHGNILVVDGQLRLVDYDGMFVPALAGRETHEIGHRNYQHPARGRQHFGPNLDHFSAWVVYISLLALSAEPELWRQFHGGDECLLMRRADFEVPVASPLLAALSLSPDARTRRAVQEFQILLQLPPEAVPPLGAAPPRPPETTVCLGCGRPSAGRSTRCPKCGWDPGAGPAAALPAWLIDHLPKATGGAEIEAPAAEPAEASDISWIFERLATDAAPLSFTAPIAAERLWFWMALVISGAAAGAAMVHLVPLLAVFEALGVLYPALLAALAWRFRRDPGVRERLEVRRILPPVERRLRKLDRRNRANHATVSKLRQSETRLTALCRARADEIDAREQRGLGAIRAEHRRRLAGAADARRRLQVDEAAVLRRLEGEFTRRIAELGAEIDALPGDEEARRQMALAKGRARAFAIHLQRYRVSAANIPGVGSSTIAALVNAGILTAADVDFVKVHAVRGFHPQRVAAVMQWRHNLEAGLVAPVVLPPGVTQYLRAETEAKRRALEDERGKKQNQLANERAIVQNSYARSRKELDQEDVSAQSKAQAASAMMTSHSRRQRQRLQGHFDPQFRKIAARIAHLRAEGAECRRQTCELAWKRSQLLHRLGAVRGLTFRAYLRRVAAGK